MCFSGVSYRRFLQVSNIAKLGKRDFKIYLFTNLLCSYLVMVSVSQKIQFMQDIYIYTHTHTHTHTRGAADK